jgi:hypothetical protein
MVLRSWKQLTGSKCLGSTSGCYLHLCSTNVDASLRFFNKYSERLMKSWNEFWNVSFLWGTCLSLCTPWLKKGVGFCLGTFSIPAHIATSQSHLMYACLPPWKTMPISHLVWHLCLPLSVYFLCLSTGRVNRARWNCWRKCLGFCRCEELLEEVCRLLQV